MKLTWKDYNLGEKIYITKLHKDREYKNYTLNVRLLHFAILFI